MQVKIVLKWHKPSSHKVQDWAVEFIFHKKKTIKKTLTVEHVQVSWMTGLCLNVKTRLKPALTGDWSWSDHAGMKDSPIPICTNARLVPETDADLPSKTNRLKSKQKSFITTVLQIWASSDLWSLTHILSRTNDLLSLSFPGIIAFLCNLFLGLSPCLN